MIYEKNLPVAIPDSSFKIRAISGTGESKNIDYNTLRTDGEYAGKALAETDPGTPTTRVYWVCDDISPTVYTNFGGQTANKFDRFYWNGTSWDLVPYSEIDFTKFNDTDPSTIGTPESGKYFEGVFGGKPWIKDDAGNITYVYDELFALGY